jgi:hypothetical protein
MRLDVYFALTFIFKDSIITEVFIHANPLASKDSTLGNWYSIGAIYSFPAS